MRRLIIFLMALLFSCTVYASDYENHWASDYINFAIDNNFASGTDDGIFEPDRNIKRCEFIKLLINYTQIKSTLLYTTFNDVDTSSWYFPSVIAAEEHNIIKGHDDGGFHPDENLTREDAVTFICRAYNITPPSEIISNNFSDFDEISPYAKNYFSFSLKNNLISGYDNNVLKPKNNITRAEAIVLLTKFSDKSYSFEQVPKFVSGYPEISPKGKINNITLTLKTDIPCTIYYKILKSPSEFPDKSEITDILASPSTAYEEVTASIIPDSPDGEYDIYFLAMTDNGASSKVEKYKSIKPLVYSSGAGTVENPYIIYNENQLDYIRYCQDKHFKLANDIVLTKEWTPIDASEGYFGSLNGNGHTISNLNIKEGYEYSGFFSVIKNGIIKNLTLKGNVKGKNNVGIFAGKNESCTITGCVAIGEVTAASNNAGGITGVNKGSILNSLSAVYSVTSKSNAGGITGTNGGNITNCISAVYSVTSGIYSGGIAGINTAGCIKNCLSANIITKNELAYNNGIITTNKESGTTVNNYSLKDTDVNVSNSLSDKNNINGMTVSWNDIKNMKFYREKLNFSSAWKLSDKSKFILPLPSSFSEIDDTEGKTPYIPIKISDSTAFYNIEPDKHYILTSDIYFNGDYHSKNSYSEFTGSIDGRGHTVHNIKIPYTENKTSYNIFGTLTGFIRNINFDNVYIYGDIETAVICSSNYGTIENTKIKGKIYSEENLASCGGIAVYNYGIIDNCDAEIDFDLKASSLTSGGIVSHNEGFINNCSYKGKFTASSSDELSAGGISGLNNGFIYNSASNSDIIINSKQCYAGGICGIFNSGEIFKTSSNGVIKINDTQSSYAGGISGISSEGLIFSSFSKMNINTKSVISYAGGISGYNISSSIQECYSVNTISALSDTAFAGGISGINESGFISSNAAINPWILSNGTTNAISASENTEYLSNNYAFDGIITEPGPNNGTPVKLKEFYNSAFFFLPVYENGKLGWSSDKYEDSDAIWTTAANFKFPLLKDVKLQSEFIMPQEF